ncbi:alpha-1,3-mannosyltransferase ALG2 [Salpingoeca rosetta]|uniref:Alpha-1,3/1,6-mannosyltransferase ALG2 n=1 Tax=Salpingoeca rosetta (strain ATCC 50818 / BSB-021) TaxID=946362 RepID=F2UE90_SALR5|nr:alpha-1,3-mannosyltransferase ALG2 [Salpingoeca rosetta]EGD74940.1 alpha-1,3-mannosyltransferase ALG2 [Salpingoeca rosetta]|eukprot:XP_004992585.1 alpha-1,3-mannosyltransferase ALG2 [Salpingoeca rosetta]
MPSKAPSNTQSPQRHKEKKKIVFFHPDLGIGGAERLVVDAALAYQSRGHNVTIATAHHEPHRCFSETADGTIDVIVRGDWLPRSCMGRLHAFFAYLRMIYLVIAVSLTTSYDVAFVDQVAACIPFVHLIAKAKVLFYCHFPDMLLTQRKTLLKRLYRAPIDYVEETTTGMADVIMVNSMFTRQTFFQTFTSLRSRDPLVVYPSLNFSSFDGQSFSTSAANKLAGTMRPRVFLSINRYERKKNLSLALDALAALRDELRSADRAREWNDVHLVLAGGYDPRLQENVAYFDELKARATTLDIQDHVTFIRSFSDADKVQLLLRCTCLVYTPDREHFGITPLEAMYMGRPVIAVNSGGPVETVVSASTHEPKDSTGILCQQTSAEFGKAMLKMLDESFVRQLSSNCKQHVVSKFSFASFTQRLTRALNA